ncbi:MAG: bifunctional phosphoribosylaminoimidazolecarboxamide formyltransferase/IMP cyclohydrolase [Candidatus Promineofilum sp.]|nr:bifunctional phosphoribosylaminoimidazolecarboxamide formyltransferase/IMP cyclohydrolase [Promineifilum sp.]
MTKRAIFSVADKTGIADLARALAALGWELIASGGTSRALRQAGLTVRDVADLTGAPEMLGGRVKTLHPAIHGGLLARDTPADRAELAAAGIDPINMVVCNLYPFAATVAAPGVTLDEALEQIDIGGAALLRAAAKNFDRVAVLCDPADYDRAAAAVRSGGPDLALRREWAVKAFALTQAYDATVAAYLGATAGQEGDALPERLDFHLTRNQRLRYGENPHQTAALYATGPGVGPLGGRLVQGKALSYNNLLDLDAAWRAAESFLRPAVVIAKHQSPCGAAIGPSAAEAFPAALASDPLSAFGGVIAVNRPVDGAFVAQPALADLYVEAIIAPAFSEEALVWFAAHKKNCRLVALGESVYDEGPSLELRTIRGGLLAQTRDDGDPSDGQWRVAGRRAPTAAEEAALRFAWIVCAHVKSNAIVLAHETATVGIGGGLPSRVDAVRLAVTKAGDRARAAVLASDAFFPFADGLEVAAAAGVTAVVEPGGSVRDDEVIAAADRLGIALVITGTRHFRH